MPHTSDQPRTASYLHVNKKIYQLSVLVVSNADMLQAENELRLSQAEFDRQVAFNSIQYALTLCIMLGTEDFQRQFCVPG